MSQQISQACSCLFSEHAGVWASFKRLLPILITVWQRLCCATLFTFFGGAVRRCFPVAMRPAAAVSGAAVPA